MHHNDPAGQNTATSTTPVQPWPPRLREAAIALTAVANHRPGPQTIAAISDAMDALLDVDPPYPPLPPIIEPVPPETGLARARDALTQAMNEAESGERGAEALRIGLAAAALRPRAGEDR